MRKVAALLALVLLCPLAGLAAAPAQNTKPALTRLLRYPDASADKVAFVYAGDIWVVDNAGGNARRLTSGPGEELFPKFSPDGRWIAFTGQYSGTRQVYVIGVEGGEPRQLTFYNDVGSIPPRGGVDNQVMDWTPDGKYVLFNAHRLPWSDRMPRPYIVPADGGMETPLVVPEGGTGMYSPDGKQYVYAPISREFRTWKRYRGGRNSDIWIYDLANNTSAAIVESPATDQLPCWVGDTIYFASDREKLYNLFAYDTKTKQLKKVTTHADFDVLWPSAGPNSVVYECGGYIYRYDVASGRDERVPIVVTGDFPHTIPYFKNVKDNIDSFDISPTGARAVFAARGDIFTVPAKEGEIRNLTNTPGIRELAAAWSPDGKWIAYQSDRTGEYELYLRRQDGTGEERRLTNGLNIWMFPAIWSPDSKKLAWGDKNQRLRYIDIDTGKIVDVDHSTTNDIGTYTWAPDSKWIAYTKNAETQYSTIWVHNLTDGKNYQLSTGMTNDDSPAFDPKGRYLYFVSNRDFNLTFSSFEFNYVYTNPTRVYVAVLSKDGPALFLPKSDEEKPKEEKPAATATPAPEPPKPAEGAQAAATAAPVVKIDVDGFDRRVRAIPGAPGNYGGLAATPDGVLYITGQGPGSKLEFYNVEAKEKQTILDGVTGYALSADGKQVLYQSQGNYGIIGVRSGQKAGDGQLALDKMNLKIDPRQEWQQEYVDVWRILRDWFYDPGMDMIDWNGVRAKYQPLIPFVATRSDLDYVFGEIAGELNTGHAYVTPGDSESVERVDTGLLGADIVADPSGYFKIAKIFPGENWSDDFRSPLTEPGIKASEGEFILAVNGRSTKGVKNFYELMENRTGEIVTLTLNSRPETAGAHDEMVRPIRKETNLRYLDWVQSRRAYVEKASGGRIGYIHLPNTANEGNRELFKGFYQQAQKEALIIDDRYNGGGFIPDRMIELLDRPLLNYWSQRGLELNTIPNYTNNGPKVTLINGYSSSGGDAFPYYFRKRGLGPLIGTRTWGGLIGISGNPSVVDGGNISAPRFRFLDTDGKWAVENEGVSPDIEVVDRPDLVAKGQDPTLERAVTILMEELRKNPPKKIVAPPPPDGR